MVAVLPAAVEVVAAAGRGNTKPADEAGINFGIWGGASASPLAIEDGMITG